MTFVFIAILAVGVGFGLWLIFRDGIIADDETSERLAKADREQRIREGKLP